MASLQHREGSLGASPHLQHEGAALGCTVCMLTPSPGSQASRRGGCTQSPYMAFLKVEFTWVPDSYFFSSL